RVLQRGVSVTLDGEQAGVGELPGHGLCRLVRRGWGGEVVVHEDRGRGGAGPRGRGGGLRSRPACGTHPGAPRHAAADAPRPVVAERLEGGVAPWVARVGTLGASHRVNLFGSWIWHGTRRWRGFLRRAMLPQILQLGCQGAPQQVDVVEAHDRGAYG